MRKRIPFLTLMLIFTVLNSASGEETKIIIEGDPSPTYNQIHEFTVSAEGELVNGGKSHFRVYDKNTGTTIFENLIILDKSYVWSQHIVYPSFNENQTYVIEVKNGNYVSNAFEFTPVRDIQQEIEILTLESQWIFEHQAVKFKHVGGKIKNAQFDKEDRTISFSFLQGTDGYFRIEIPRDLLNSFEFCKETDFEVLLNDNPIEYSEDTSDNITRILQVNLVYGNFGTLEIVGTHALMSLDEIKGEACTNTKVDTSNPRYIMIADVNDKEGISLKNVVDYEDDLEYLHIIGEVVNNQDKAIEYVRIVVALYDQSNNILDTDFSFSDVQIIPPYGKSPFDVTFTGGSSGVANYKLETEGRETNPLPMGLQLGRPRIFTDDLGYVHVVGEVRNKGDTTANYVKVNGILYDSSKNLIGVDFTFTEFSDIYPDQSSSFELTFSDVLGEPASYELYVESQEYGMIYVKPIQHQETSEEKPSEEKPTTAQETTPSLEQTPSSKSGGCLIATAAFGSELAPQVQMLRETRDNIVLKTQSGSSFMTTFNSIYYTFAPTVAEWERESSFFKEIIKVAITPLITTLSILNYVDIDSEAEMLGYGIGIIVLNIGMYFVAPVFLIMKIRRISS